jgi:hypothetical protein
MNNWHDDLCAKFKFQAIFENRKVFDKRKLELNWKTYFKKKCKLMVINFVGLGWVCVGLGQRTCANNWVELWGSTPSLCFRLVYIWFCYGNLGYILVSFFFVNHRIEIFICISFVHIYHVGKLKTLTSITCQNKIRKKSVIIWCNNLNFLLECIFFFVKKMIYVLLVFTQ